MDNPLETMTGQLQPADGPHELQLLSSARRVLSQARSIDEVKDLRDKAAAVKAYAQKAKLGREMVVEASVVRLEAERRLGELLAGSHLASATLGNQHQESSEANGFRLADLGITKSESSRAQKLASIQQPAFEAFVNECVESQREATAAAALRTTVTTPVEPPLNGDVIEHRPADSGDGRVVRDLSELINEGGQYGCLYADPPWPYQNQGTRGATSNHYRSMSLEEIAALPVDRLAAEAAHLHLWTTNAFAREALDLIVGWGFVPKSCLVWVKPQMGMGDYWRVAHEFLVLGVRRRPAFRRPLVPQLDRDAMDTPQRETGRDSTARRAGQSRTVPRTLRPQTCGRLDRVGRPDQ